MPSLTDVNLQYTFDDKEDITIIGGTHFIPLSQLDIGAFQDYFNH